MIFDDTTRSLQIVLSGVVTTNELPVVVGFIVGILPQSLLRKAQTSVSNGTTAVTVLSAPSTKESRTVTFISVRNADTASATVTVSYNDNAVIRDIITAILAVDDTLIFTEEEGFKVIDKDGAIKGTGGGASTDADAIHDNVAAEISVITEKVTPVNADLVIIEDSAASNAKKRVQVGNLPGGGGSDIGARVFSSVNLTITNNTLTALTFNSERYDTDTIHDNSTNNTRLTATTAGKYVITGHAKFDVNGTGRRQVGIRVNGSTIIALWETAITSAAGGNIFSIATIDDLSATDYVELVVFQDSGGNLDVKNDANFGAEFTMQKIG